MNMQPAGGLRYVAVEKCNTAAFNLLANMLIPDDPKQVKLVATQSILSKVLVALAKRGSDGSSGGKEVKSELGRLLALEQLSKKRPNASRFLS